MSITIGEVIEQMRMEEMERRLSKQFAKSMNRAMKKMMKKARKQANRQRKHHCWSGEIKGTIHEPLH